MTCLRKQGMKMLISLSYSLELFRKRSEHVEGFAKECAVVTHHRLEEGQRRETGSCRPLEEPLIVRPTSETIIGATFRQMGRIVSRFASTHQSMVQCHALGNAHAHVFAHDGIFMARRAYGSCDRRRGAEQKPCRCSMSMNVLLKNYLAIPVIKGEKTPSERFPGAVNTYTIEAMMQDRKALQSGTSHFLGQNFAKAFDIKFRDVDGEKRHAWTTSWGITTRLIGAMIMTHSDDNGLCLAAARRLCADRVASYHP